MAARLLPQVDAPGCEALTEAVKLFCHRSEQYFYPDLMVTCHPLDLQTRHRSPLLVVEVLSQRNRHRERATKLREYIQLPSLQHYLLVNQEACLVQHYRRREAGGFDILTYDSLADLIDLPELDFLLSLSDIYQGIEFGPEISEAEEAAAAYVTESQKG